MIGSLIGGAVSGIGSLFGGIRAKKQMKKAEKQIYRQKEENRKWWEQQRGTDYLDTSEARSVLSDLRAENREQLEAAGNDLVRGGASSEARVATAGRLNRNYSQNVNRLAGLGTRYSESLRQEYRNRDERYDNQLDNLKMGRAAAASSLGDAFTAAGRGLTASGLFDSASDW